MKTFKTEEKFAEFSDKLEKQSLVLKGELDYIQGEKVFEKGIRGAESLNMDDIYDALDLFGNASKIAFAQ